MDLLSKNLNLAPLNLIWLAHCITIQTAPTISTHAKLNYKHEKCTLYSTHLILESPGHIPTSTPAWQTVFLQSTHWPPFSSHGFDGDGVVGWLVVVDVDVTGAMVGGGEKMYPLVWWKNDTYMRRCCKIFLTNIIPPLKSQCWH